MTEERKQFNGDAIYNPKNKAAEYSSWACNFYTGCSCLCTYCFNKNGRFKATLGGNAPTLKKCFRYEKHALDVFEKELKQNLTELQQHGLFFSFSTDPMLPNATIYLTGKAVPICIANGVPVKILTKRADWLNYRNYFTDFFLDTEERELAKKYIAFGFTLTGRDDLEPNASTNAERIEAMKKLHNVGFLTWASIEPVIDFESSVSMIWKIQQHCDLIKVGLERGKKYDRDLLRDFMERVLEICYGRTTNIDEHGFMPKWGNLRTHFEYDPNCEYFLGLKKGMKPLDFKKDWEHLFKVYFKDSLLKQAGIDRLELPDNCVNRDYNIFKNR
jgi:DNA repair photolyase